MDDGLDSFREAAASVVTNTSTGAHGLWDMVDATEHLQAVLDGVPVVMRPAWATAIHEGNTWIAMLAREEAAARRLAEKVAEIRKTLVRWHPEKKAKLSVWRRVWGFVTRCKAEVCE